MRKAQTWLIALIVLLVVVGAGGVIVYYAYRGTPTGAVVGGQPTVILLSAPASGTVGDPITIAWHIDPASGTITHSSVHLGAQSIASPQAPTDYPQESSRYCESTPCSGPTDLSTQFTISQPGTYYYRVDAMVNGQQIWSGEIPIVVNAAAVTPTVTVTAAPTSVQAGQSFTISWHVDTAPGTIPHTAVHYGPTPVPAPTGPADYPYNSTYLCTSAACPVPNDFSAQMVVNMPGTYYYRAHAVVNGANVWSPEMRFVVTQAAITGQQTEVTIKNMAYTPSTITVNVGDTVVWTNSDTVPHTVSSDSGTELASTTLQPGATYTHTFNKAGRYAYHCNIHAYMRGTVIVRAAGDTSAVTSTSDTSGGSTTGSSSGSSGYY